MVEIDVKRRRGRVGAAVGAAVPLAEEGEVLQDQTGARQNEVLSPVIPWAALMPRLALIETTMN